MKFSALFYIHAIQNGLLYTLDNYGNSIHVTFITLYLHFHIVLAILGFSDSAYFEFLSLSLSWGSHTVTMNSNVFWVIKPCSSEKLPSFGEHSASAFKVEK
jgi:hypothetical protein